MKENTQMIHSRLDSGKERELSTPVYMNSGFGFEDADEMEKAFKGEMPHHVYGRWANPNTDEFVRKMCLLEGAESGFATATGMAAVFASIAGLLRSGDHMLVSASIFGTTQVLVNEWLPRFGISHTYFTAAEIDHLTDFLQPNTRMIYVETPSNPGLEIFDLQLLGDFARRNQLILNVDNCFATPVLQKPLQFGAHIVTHSATKFIDGQGRVLGGIVLGDAAPMQQVIAFLKTTGATMSPMTAWILSKSLETLELRMERHCSNALAVAEFLSQHTAVEFVNYPGLPAHCGHEINRRQMKNGGALVTFGTKGGKENAVKVLNHLKMIAIAANLGDACTIATHPATSTHCKLSAHEKKIAGISDNLIRLSIGLEHAGDIIDDLNQALCF
jgi:O-succinylhomoserine sulfhydrylase